MSTILAAPSLGADQVVSPTGVHYRTSPSVTSARSPLTPLDRMVWIWLRDSGGWQTWQEICDDLDLPTGRGGPSSLNRLFHRCHVARRPARVTYGNSTCDAWAYGVTATCTPIDGETLQPAELAS